MPAKFSILTVAAIPLLPIIPLLACGGDDGGGVHVLDASVDGRPIDAPEACTAAASNPSVADFGSNQRASSKGTGSAQEMNWFGPINADAMPDLLAIDLYAGYGAFEGMNISPKTITLTGVEADYASCGACVLLLTDLHQAGSGAAITDTYMANGGTLTLTSTATNFTGSLSNVTFRRVMIGSGGATTNVGTCASGLDGGSFTAPITIGSAGFTGDIDNGRLIIRHRNY